MSNSLKDPSSRRQFLKKSALGVMGISLASRAFPAFKNPLNKVVLVRHENVIESSGHAQPGLVEEMLNRAMTELTGVSLEETWKQFFSPDDVIGLKVNMNSLSNWGNTGFASHYPALTSAIINSCQASGIGEEQFIIWERSVGELKGAGYTPNDQEGKLRILGTNESRREPGGIGFHPESFPVGDQSSRVSRILTDLCTSMINVPVLKSHRGSGITAALKNHFGSIDNPGSYHDSNCNNPGIAEVNAIPVIRKKQRLVICDALQAVYEGGPGWTPGYVWPYGVILVGTDPVAIDRVCLDILNEKRIESGLQSASPYSGHIDLSAKLGLGVVDLKKIDLVEIAMK